MNDREAMYAMTLEQIGERLGTTREYVRLIERRALLKVRCALAIEEALGGRAAPVLEQLRGKRLRHFEEAARALRDADPLEPSSCVT